MSENFPPECSVVRITSSADLFLNFWVSIHGNAAAVVPNGHYVIAGKFKLDPTSVPRDGLIHGIVENFRSEMVQSTFIRATDIHAWTTADWFEPLQDLDIFGGIGRGTIDLAAFWNRSDIGQLYESG